MEQVETKEIKTKLNPEARAKLAVELLMNDSQSRLESQRNAEMYLLRCEKEKDETPHWQWAILYVLLGFVTAMAMKLSWLTFLAP